MTRLLLPKQKGSFESLSLPPVLRIVSALTCAGLLLLLYHAFGGTLLRTVFTIPVALVALITLFLGCGAALVFTICTGVGLWVLLQQTADDTWYRYTADLEFVRVIAYFAVSLAVIGTTELMHRTRRRLEAAKRVLKEQAQEARAAEQALRASRDTLQAVLDAVPVGIVLADASGGIAMASRATERILGSPVSGDAHGPEPSGVSSEEGEAAYRFSRPDGGEVRPGELPLSLALKGRDVTDAELKVIRRDRSEAIIVASATPMRAQNGEIEGAVAVIQDITDRKRTEEALRASEATVNAILDTLPIGLIIADARGRIIRDNAATRELWGVPPETQSWEEYTDWVGWWPETGERIRAEEWAMTRALVRGETTRGELVQNQRFGSGERRAYLNYVAPLRDGENRIVGGVAAMVDVTDRLNMERVLRESEERCRTLADNMSQLAWIADETGRAFWFNRRWFEYTGTTLSEMQGWGWCKTLHPDQVDRVVENFSHAFRAGEAWEDTFLLRGKDGAHGWFLSRAVPIRDDAGRVVRWFGTHTDVTEQRATEDALRAANHRLQEADQRKNEFLALLSHELRNPLAPIRNSIYILEHAAPGGQQAIRARQVIDRQAQHMTRLIEDLLDVTRISRGKVILRRERIDLDELVRGTADDHRDAFLKSGVALEVRSAGEPTWVDGDRTRLAQVVGNLLNNAAKFTPRGGRTVVSVEVTPPQEGKLRGSVVVHVRDNGVGISAEALEHLFEPFVQAAQTLERAHGGLGLGLALVKGLVEMHGGNVVVRSPGEGQGAHFAFSLPICEPPNANDQPVVQAL